jgi:hypothetical protein
MSERGTYIMKRFILLPLVALVFAGCEPATEPERAAVSPTLHASAAASGYQIIDIGTLGGVESQNYSINDRGRVAHTPFRSFPDSMESRGTWSLSLFRFTRTL